MNKTHLDAYLQDLSEKSKLLPKGSYSEIAKRFNVSRELVRQKAKKLGLKIKYKKPDYKICDYCGKKYFPKTADYKFCSKKCFHLFGFYRGNILVLCKTCGKGVLRKIADVKRSSSNEFYCSRKCYSKSDHLNVN